MAPPKWKTEVVSSHKFEFINIPDFHSTTYLSYLRYLWVWLMFIKTIRVMCGDIWTCCVLLISGDWTTNLQPVIEISIARWIFSGCILLSFVLVALDFLKANRVIKSNDISYTVSNTIVSTFYMLRKYDYFCFFMKIHNSNKITDKLSFFVFFQLKGWKHLVVQAPRQVINIMTLVAFMKTAGFDLDRIDEIVLPDITQFSFYVMAFTSLIFVISALMTLIAMLLWIPLVFKIQGNLKEYVCHKMDKRINAIIQETIKERARKAEMLERKLEEAAQCNNGSQPRVQRLKPTLPNIDVILANTNQDDRRYGQASYQQQIHMHIQMQHQTTYDQSQRHHPISHEIPRRAAYQPPQSQHSHLPNRNMSMTSDYLQGGSLSEYYSPSLYQASPHSAGTATRSNHSYPMRPHVSPRLPYRNIAQYGDYHGQQPHVSPSTAPVRQPAHCDTQEEWLAAAYLDLPTPESEPGSFQYRPDSGVLPDTTDPYYLAMTAPSPAHSTGSYGSSQPSPTRYGVSYQQRQQQSRADGIYLPDKSEIEQYDALCRDWSESHQRVKQARNVSARPQSSSTQSSAAHSSADGGPMLAYLQRRDAPRPPPASLPSMAVSSPIPSSAHIGGSSLAFQSSRTSNRTPLRAHESPLQQLCYIPSSANMADEGFMSTELTSAGQVSVSKLSEKPSSELLALSARSTYSTCPSQDSSPVRETQVWVPTAAPTTHSSIRGNSEVTDEIGQETASPAAHEAIDKPLHIDDVLMDIALSMDSQAQAGMEQQTGPGDKQEYSEHQQSLLDELLGEIDVCHEREASPAASALSEAIVPPPDKVHATGNYHHPSLRSVSSMASIHSFFTH